MSKRKKILIIVASSILAVLIIGFAVLYSNGLSGLHNHKKVKGGQIKVACVGDSITYGHGIKSWARNNYPAQLQKLLGDEYHVANFGESGRTLSPNGDQPYWESKQYELSLEYDADILVVMLGTNDSKPENWTGVDDFVKHYNDLIESYLEVNPEMRVIICTPAKSFFSGNKSEGTTNFDIQPNIVSEIRNAVRLFGLTQNFEVIDVYDLTENHREWFESDNVHPSNDGARAIAQLVADKIK